MHERLEVDKVRTIRRILRVNHAGEHGAVSIYTYQLARSRQTDPDLVPWLRETLTHEKAHRAKFLDAMPNRSAKPCRALFIWSVGGTILGLLTSLLGRTGIMACTAAVERTVHRHLAEQIDFLKTCDEELAELVRSIQKEEDEHLAFAVSHHDRNSVLAVALSVVVALSTELLIFVSTRGDSLRLRSDLKSAGG